MKKEEHPTIYRQDYQVPLHCIDSTYLTFQLYETFTDVIAKTDFRKNPESNVPNDLLFLDGENLELITISYNGRTLDEKDYTISEKGLSIPVADERFTLEITTRIYPDQNTSLEGLYRSSGNYCTQCEAEGFRKITYYLDRPDILATFTTRIEGDKRLCPVMLSNGNMIEEGVIDDMRHYSVWHDPFPKPCYLFALVAGDLHFIEDLFTTMSGREITLRIYVEERNITKCDHAMRSLKKSMQWDEEVYGREYDLDIFMIVAVDDFNMGAMENKGLNVFNSKFILALPETATDSDYLGIEGVVAHEYFHNWTGNRVTCRDWFQLSLKEGLTVFRDQEFSSDINSRAVQRIDDVRILRTNQFREDSGPMAHPVRPDSYVEINNFYTVTVYNKGAEVIRMMHTLLGKDGFRKGTDLYFERHDGQAVTCDDFITAMADANDYDLDQFTRWYSQAGTPFLEVKEHFKEDDQEYSITIKQSCSATPGQQVKEPFHVPIVIGLLDEEGRNIHITENDSLVLELKEEEETFSFIGFEKKPVLSFLRNFSAPVQVKPFQPEEELAFLMAHDSDLYNRWEASSQLAEHILFEAVRVLQSGETPTVKEHYLQAVTSNISAGQQDKALLAQSLRLPAETYLAGLMTVIDPDNLHLAHNLVRREIASRLQKTFSTIYLENHDTDGYEITPGAMGRRSLKNCALDYLMALDPLPPEVVGYCLAQYESRANMTDVMSALSLIANSNLDVREDILQDFYDTWRHDPLVMDKWFIIQATSRREDTLEKVQELMTNPLFSIKNPNKVRSLVGAFGSMNHVRFHHRNGAGYTFIADRIIELNTINPQIAARLVSPFSTWKKYDSERQLMMRDQLERILNTADLSGDVFEVVKKCL